MNRLRTPHSFQLLPISVHYRDLLEAVAIGRSVELPSARLEETSRQLRLADGSSKKLGPFSTYATFGMEDWGQMDLRPGAAEPLLEDAFVPMADAITREKPG